MSKINKSAFIRAHNNVQDASDVVALAKAQGIKITTAFVHAIRFADRKAAGIPSRSYVRKAVKGSGKSRAKRTVKASSTTPATEQAPLHQALAVLRGAGVAINRTQLRKKLANVKREREAAQALANEAASKLAAAEKEQALLQSLIG